MRAISLPINALILIILAVIALISLIAFFYPGFISSSETVSAQSALNMACMEYLNKYNCEISPMKIAVDFDADKDGKILPKTDCAWTCEMNNPPSQGCDNLYELGACWFGCGQWYPIIKKWGPNSDTTKCIKKLCKCP